MSDHTITSLNDTQEVLLKALNPVLSKLTDTIQDQIHLTNQRMFCSVIRCFYTDEQDQTEISYKASLHTFDQIDPASLQKVKHQKAELHAEHPGTKDGDQYLTLLVTPLVQFAHEPKNKDLQSFIATTLVLLEPYLPADNFGMIFVIDAVFDSRDQSITPKPQGILCLNGLEPPAKLFH